MNIEKNILFRSVSSELESVQEHLADQLPLKAGSLKEMVKFVLSGKGKLLRPALAILSGHLTGELKNKHFILAQITELIHTASLVHDDLLDEASLRRGQETCHLKWGTKVSVIVGDFLFAQASLKLGEIENTEIVKIYAKVLADLCTGEVSQAQNRFNLQFADWDNYLNKSISKTASLFSAATQSAAILNQQNPEIVQKMFLYGHNLGLAFQIIDDLIDFTSSSEELGKPALGDLKQGVFTAPLLFAIQKPEYKNQLAQLINSRFETEGDLLTAQKLISDSGAFKETLDFAQGFISKALTALDNFEDNIYKQDLKQIAEFILQRNF